MCVYVCMPAHVYAEARVDAGCASQALSILILETAFLAGQSLLIRLERPASEL